MNDGDTEAEGAAFRRVTALAAARELEAFGIGDGMFRRAPDPFHAGSPDYATGYAAGLALPPQPEPDPAGNP